MHRASMLSPARRCCCRRRRRALPVRRRLSSSICSPPYAAAGARPSVGLLGLEGLHRAEDFEELAQDAENRCDSLRGQAAAWRPEMGGDRLIRQLDAISSAVCAVIDVAEVTRSVHACPRWRSAAEGTFSRLSGYIQRLNTDTRLHESLRRLTDCSSSVALLSPEQQRIAHLLQSEFEREGIGLSSEDRSLAATLHARVTQLETDYSAGIMSLPTRGKVAIEGREGLQEILLDQGSVQMILRTVADPRIRKAVWWAANNAAAANIPILDELLQARRELAHLLGYRSFAHRALEDKMVQSPEAVEEMLMRIAGCAEVKAHQEVALLLRAKATMEGPQSGDLAPWDIPYYVAHLKGSTHHIDSRAISAYFSLENCLESLTILCNELFGISVRRCPLMEGEGWAATGEGSVTNESSIIKLQLSHPQSGDLGSVYLDLLPRDGKVHQAAHFTVRCGCAVNPFLSFADADGAGALSRDGMHQLPIVVLVASFGGGSAARLLSHSEFETLLHEFGHALHSLLSRTESQHLSGTRGPVDFVEMPSHLMEYFAWEGNVVGRFARHIVTGQPIPAHTIGALRQSKHMFAGIETQTQILYALADQRLCGTQDESSSSIVETCHGELGAPSLPHVPGMAWHGRFGHLTGYGGCYYAYLHAKVLASSIWHARFAHKGCASVLSRDAGERLWMQALVHGGAKDPHDMVRDLLDGESASVQHLLGEWSS